jgi:hypothetical protein
VVTDITSGTRKRSKGQSGASDTGISYTNWMWKGKINYD